MERGTFTPGCSRPVLVSDLPIRDPISREPNFKHPLSGFLEEVEEALGEAALVGIAHGDPLTERRWQALIEQGEQLGLVRFLELARRLQVSLAARKGSLAWDVSPSVQAALHLALAAAYGIRGRN